MQSTLDDLGLKYRTDKASPHHDYLRYYEELFAPIREDRFDMLEIGVKRGASIRMWHDYFPAAHIVGVDVKPVSVDGDLPRFTFERGSQADPVFLRKLLQQYKFRIVIDDGSHLWGHQIFTFQTIVPWLEQGSIYICEDIQTSFGTEYSERFSGDAKESAAAYFLRVAQAVIIKRGGSKVLKPTEDPLLYFIADKIQSVTFIQHCAIFRC